MAQQSSYLESVTKFNITNPRAKNIYEEKEFFKWSDKHFYRTSSNDMTAKVTIILILTNFLIDACCSQNHRFPWIPRLRPPHRCQQPSLRQNPY